MDGELRKAQSEKNQRFFCLLNIRNVQDENTKIKNFRDN